MTDLGVDYAHTPEAAKARHAKSQALARFLYRNGYTPDAARHLTGKDWAAAARAAGVNPPGTQDTIDEVVGRLAAGWERWGPPPETDLAAPAGAVEQPARLVVTPGVCRWQGCGAGGAHLYPEGWRCDLHAPWARAGMPHPDRVVAQANKNLARKLGATAAS